LVALCMPSFPEGQGNPIPSPRYLDPAAAPKLRIVVPCRGVCVP
jgi:hypothetical protein